MNGFIKRSDYDRALKDLDHLSTIIDTYFEMVVDRPVAHEHIKDLKQILKAYTPIELTPHN